MTFSNFFICLKLLYTLALNNMVYKVFERIQICQNLIAGCYPYFCVFLVSGLLWIFSWISHIIRKITRRTTGSKCNYLWLHSIYIYLHLSTSLYISLHHSTSLSTSIYLYLPLSTSIYLYLPLSTSIYLYLPLSTSIYLYIFLSISSKILTQFETFWWIYEWINTTSDL